MDGGAQQATVHGVAKSQTQLSDFTLYKLLTSLSLSCLIYKPGIIIPVPQHYYEDTMSTEST